MSFRQLIRDMAALRPTLYYATQEDVERGQVYHAAATKFAPEYIVCHPADLEEIGTCGWALVHLREWKPQLSEFKFLTTTAEVE